MKWCGVNDGAEHALPVAGNVCQVSKRGRHGRFVAQPNNSLSPIGMAVALLGKYFRYGNLVYSDSTLILKTWVRPPMPSLLRHSRLTCRRMCKETCLMTTLSGWLAMMRS